MNNFFLLITILLLLIFTGCGSKTTNEQKPVATKEAPMQKILSISSISFEKQEVPESIPMTALSEKLGQKAIDCSYYSYREADKELLHQNFLQLLGKDFKNDVFREVTAIQYLELRFKKSAEHECIKVEEWGLKNEEQAQAIFDSLKKYKEVSITYKPAINWIWLQNGSQIYLISSETYTVSDKKMQLIKDELLNLIGNKSKSIQFFE